MVDEWMDGGGIRRGAERFSSAEDGVLFTFQVERKIMFRSNE